MSEKSQEWTVEKVMAEYKMSRVEAIQALRLMGVVTREVSDQMNGEPGPGIEQNNPGWWHGGE
jgi:hypothetical protein